jgi:hypothetical protein
MIRPLFSTKHALDRRARDMKKRQRLLSVTSVPSVDLPIYPSPRNTKSKKCFLPRNTQNDAKAFSFISSVPSVHFRVFRVLPLITITPHNKIPKTYYPRSTRMGTKKS